MSETSDFVPVRKVIKIINSCETMKQLKSCVNIIDTYVRLIKSMGVVNSVLVRKRLMKEYNQKKFQLNMIKTFISNQEQEFEKESVEVA